MAPPVNIQRSELNSALCILNTVINGIRFFFFYYGNIDEPLAQYSTGMSGYYQSCYSTSHCVRHSRNSNCQCLQECVFSQCKQTLQDQRSIMLAKAASQTILIKMRLKEGLGDAVNYLDGVSIWHSHSSD
jgi:hypothetical protein